MSLIIPSPPSLPVPAVNYAGRPTTTWGTVLTAGASHVEGAVTELVAATTSDYDTLDIMVYGTAVASVDTPALYQIYTGASFSQVLIPHLLGGYCMANMANTQGNPGAIYSFPVFIPRGTRIGASLRSITASKTAQIMIRGRWTGRRAYRRIEALGATTAASEGTNVTPGSAAEGSFTAIGTTGFDYKAVMGYVWQWNTGTVTPVSLSVLDLGTGSALINQLENVMATTGNVNEADNGIILAAPIACHVASGTALQARVNNHAANTLTRSVIIYGMA